MERPIGQDPGPEESLDVRLRALWAQAAAVGTAMPSEPTLAAALDAGRPAVREALVRLEERGYIHRRKGAGTTVNTSLLDIPARFDQRLDKSDLISRMGARPELRLGAAGRDTVSQEEATRFGLPLRTPVLRVEKSWTADGVPVLSAQDCVPVRTAAADPDLTTPLVEIATALAGETVEWELVRPSAAALSPREAQILERAPGSPVLTLDIVGLSPTGALCYWTTELHVPGAFDYAMVRRASWH